MDSVLYPLLVCPQIFLLGRMCRISSATWSHGSRATPYAAQATTMAYQDYPYGLLLANLSDSVLASNPSCSPSTRDPAKFKPGQVTPLIKPRSGCVSFRIKPISLQWTLGSCMIQPVPITLAPHSPLSSCCFSHTGHLAVPPASQVLSASGPLYRQFPPL